MELDNNEVDMRETASNIYIYIPLALEIQVMHHFIAGLAALKLL